MSLHPRLVLPVAAAFLGVLAAVLATPLLAPVKANEGAKGPAAAETKKNASEMPPALAGLATDDMALLRLGGAIVGIAAAGGGALFLLRRAKGGRFLRKRARSLEVLETLSLGNKKSLAVARVYDRVLVLGVGPERVELLSEMREEEAGLQDQDWTRGAAPAPEAGTAAFQSLLRKLASRPSKPAPREVDVPAAPRRAAPARRVTIAELEEMESARAAASERSL